MRRTTKTTTAMQRLADEAGWGVESSGRAWVITALPEVSSALYDGLTFSSLALACLLVRVLAEERGLEYHEVPKLAGWELPYIRPRNSPVYVPRIPARATATDETTLARAFPESEDHPYEEER